MSSETVGFAGLGHMGRPMATRLVAAGYRLIGFDAAGSRSRVPEGASAAESVTEVAAKAEMVCLSLPNGAISKEVSGQIGAAPNRRTETVIDLSTIGIAAARECGELLERYGVAYVDAPVSGGVAGATHGTLSIMVGAPAERFEALEPLLSVLAKNRFRIGDAPGQGQAMKLVNNYVSAAALAATCEAVVFGERLGLDAALIAEVLNVSSGRSSASQDKLPRSIVPRSYDFGFAGAMMTKDVTLYLENADAADVPHELAAAVAAVWQRFNAAYPDADFTAIHKYFSEGGD